MTWQTHQAISCGELKAEEDKARGPSWSSFTSASKLFVGASIPQLYSLTTTGTNFPNFSSASGHGPPLPKGTPTFGMSLLAFICYTITVTFVKNRNIFHSRADDQGHFSFFLMCTLPHIF